MDIFKEWKRRRPWKERKREAKAREGVGSQLARGVQIPELIFYGCRSGVVGLSRSELYRTAYVSEFQNFGYDKVKCIYFFFTFLPKLRLPVI